jgi:hypothetical protein
MECHIQIYGSGPLKISFAHFDTDLLHDFVQLQDDGNLVWKKSGLLPPFSYEQTTSTDIIVSFTTDASTAFSGFNFTWQPVPKCATNPCQHNGTCTDVDLKNFTCACMAGYSGLRCEVNTNECASNPCVNGTCEDKVNGFACTCDAVSLEQGANPTLMSARPIPV